MSPLSSVEAETSPPEDTNGLAISESERSKLIERSARCFVLATKFKALMKPLPDKSGYESYSKEADSFHAFAAALVVSSPDAEYALSILNGESTRYNDLITQQARREVLRVNALAGINVLNAAEEENGCTDLYFEIDKATQKR